MTESGKKVTTVISCTTLETVRVSDPILFYEADRAHIIYMDSEKSEKKGFYSSLVEEIERRVKEKRDVEFFLHNEKVYKYNLMLKLINDIIRSEKAEFGDFVDIYVNISSGSSEYAAAAMCVSMMNQGVIPFTVWVKEHTVPLDRFREMITVDGRPVGIAKEVHEPKMIETFSIEPPDEDLVRYLSFFAQIERKPYTVNSIMKMMEENDLWKYTPTKTKNPAKQSAKQQFNRSVLDRLKEKGWLRMGRSKNYWEVTPAGKSILDVFLNDEDNRPFREIIVEMNECRTMVCNSVMPPGFDCENDS